MVKLSEIPLDVTVPLAESDSNAALAEKLKALFFPEQP